MGEEMNEYLQGLACPCTKMWHHSVRLRDAGYVSRASSYRGLTAHRIPYQRCPASDICWELANRMYGPTQRLIQHLFRLTVSICWHPGSNHGHVKTRVP